MEIVFELLRIHSQYDTPLLYMTGGDINKISQNPSQ